MFNAFPNPPRIYVVGYNNFIVRSVGSMINEGGHSLSACEYGEDGDVGIVVDDYLCCIGPCGEEAFRQ